MKKVSLSYNPYLVKTEIKINGTVMDDATLPFHHFLDGTRLQFWMDPIESLGWEGLLAALKQQCNSEEIELTFYGTASDYRDLQSLIQKSDEQKTFTLKHGNRKTAKASDPEAKLKGLKKIYKKIQDGPVAEFHAPEIDAAFQEAMKTDFEIAVIGTYSSGKSALLNAILEQDLLPSDTDPTTAMATYIHDVDGQKEFTLSAVDRSGKTIQKEGTPATKELIQALNDNKDDTDLEEDQKKRRSSTEKVIIKGNIPSLPAKGLHTVFIDTPGGNNSLNKEHRAIMQRIIEQDDNSMLLFVCEPQNLASNDAAAILDMIAAVINTSDDQKKKNQTRDRFLFVVNKADTVDPDKEPYEDHLLANVKSVLSQHNITDPNLFLISAKTALMIHQKATPGTEFTRAEEQDYRSLLYAMNYGKCRLYEYSTLPESQKEAFRAQMEELQGQHPGDEYIPEVALINSGIPALELAITNYLEKYALPIKLKKAVDSFGSIVTQRNLEGLRQKEISGSKAVFKARKEEAEKLAKRLQEDTSLVDTIRKIDQIKFDPEPYYEQQKKFVHALTNITQQYEAYGSIPAEEADCHLAALQDRVEKIESGFKKIIKKLEQELSDKSNEAMAQYKENLEALQAHGLTIIGGIPLDKLDRYKRLKLQMRDNARYRQTNYISQTVTKKDPGFLNGIKRLFRKGGYHEETTQHREDMYRFSDFAKDSLAEMAADLSNKIGDLLADATEMVESVKSQARAQAEELSKIVEEAVESLKEKTQSWEKAQEEYEKNKALYGFAKEIIDAVNSILTID